MVEEYPRRPAKPASSERIQHPLHREKVANILQQFSKLPIPEKDAIKDNLDSSLISMEQLRTGTRLLRFRGLKKPMNNKKNNLIIRIHEINPSLIISGIDSKIVFRI